MTAFRKKQSAFYRRIFRREEEVELSFSSRSRKPGKLLGLNVCEAVRRVALIIVLSRNLRKALSDRKK
jgi:hypothetical protein